MTLPAQDIVERLRQRVDRWKLNGDSARISVPLGELRGVLAEIETYRTAFDGIEPNSRIAALEAEVGRLRAAISWIEPPFVDDQTPHEELFKRVAMCVNDARFANRAALANEEAGR